MILADLFPGGPSVTGIWERAGGDPSRLDASGDGNAQWRAALGKFRRGGGGANITAESLFAVVRDEYPKYSDLPALERALASLSPR
ncbi:effector-associated domain EAD1-containing protein [Methylobacterium frigidaeris]|uniref:effector-associated domain EAD1-containing protein n=1 Tax=Methylobacterium frigidaeris TaxID=2038277 RepID=UPI001EE03C10|nr:effector-associated domain EAD1-containing protein [Methylobacterium frigidaeris]